MQTQYTTTQTSRTNNQPRDFQGRYTNADVMMRQMEAEARWREERRKRNEAEGITDGDIIFA